MKVYILNQYYDYETGYIISVHGSFKSAQKAMYTEAKIEYSKDMARANEDESYLRIQGNNLEIQEFEVE